VDADDARVVDARDRLRLLGQTCREGLRRASVGGTLGCSDLTATTRCNDGSNAL